MPRVSVIVCAYKSEDKILPTIHAILGQTFGDFELLVIDDASGDRTSAVISSVQDDRVHLIVNEQNLGVVGSRNKGLGLAKGDYIAHCDHDDIWQPGKLEQQVAFMDAHPDVGLLGTEFTLLVDGKQVEVTHSERYSSIYFKWFLFLESTLLHSTTMMRSSVIREHGIRYLPGLNFADDWHIYHQFAKVTELMKLPDPLTDYHLHGQNWSITATDVMDQHGARFLAGELDWITGRSHAPQDTDSYFSCLVGGQAAADMEMLRTVGHMLFDVYAGFCARYQPQGDDLKAIHQCVYERWWRLVSASAGKLGFSSLPVYWEIGGPERPHPGLVKLAKAGVKALLRTNS